MSASENRALAALATLAQTYQKKKNKTIKSLCRKLLVYDIGKHL